MKAKTLVTVLLLAFVAASVTWLVIKEARAPAADETREDLNGDGPTEAGEKATVYYFHGTVRCMTCNLIEAQTRQAVAEGFAEAIESGRLELKALNVDEPDNEHFVEDYGLVTKSVVLVERRAGQADRWKNLDRVWELVHNEEAFVGYVKEELTAFLAGKD